MDFVIREVWIVFCKVFVWDVLDYVLVFNKI